MKFKKVVIWIAIVLLVVVVGLSVKYAWGKWEDSISYWNGETRRTLVILIDQDEAIGAIVVSMEAVTNSLFIMKLPNNLMLEVSNNYGNYQINSLLGLAKQEFNWKLIPNTYANLLGVPIDDWFVWGENVNCEIVNSECVSKLLASDLIRDNHESSLSILTRWRMSDIIKKLKINEVLVDGALVSWKNEFEAPDGNWELIYAQEFVDTRLAGKFVDNFIVNESLSWEIVNTTTINGLAGKTGRILNGMGGRVVRLNTIDTLLENCLIRVNNQVLNTYTINKVTNYWGCRVESVQGVDRVDAELWLGNGFDN